LRNIDLNLIRSSAIVLHLLHRPAAERPSQHRGIKERRSVLRRSLKPFFIVSLVLLLGSIIGAASYIYQQLNYVDTVKINKSARALGIKSQVTASVAGLSQPPVNIALFGLDKRPGDKFGNSDAIMIVSISYATNKIKLSSIMRDTYVNIDSVGKDKINAAFRIGGPQLAMKTLNQNFSLNIKDFVSVDFNGMAHVIDAVGGLTIDVNEEEMRWVNAYLDENNRNSKVLPPYLTRPGLQTLNGKQAVAYTRIRYVGTDDDRTQRQRTVLSLILKKLKSAGASEYPDLVGRVLPYVDTSLPKFELLSLGASVFVNDVRTIEERRFPLHTEAQGKMINGTWYLVADLKATSKSMFDYMFEGSR
jgi:polyisoprenyl-teichoic acid--peptidoglycan teichoic acid transferase